MPKKRTAEVLEKGSDDEAEIEETKVKDVNDSSHWTREEIIQIPLPTGAKNLKIMSWNVNGLKALVTTKKTTLQTLIDNRQPDVLCLQETKIQDTIIGEFDGLLDGYDAYWNCSTVKKGYAGTAVFLKKSTIFVPPGLNHSGSANGSGGSTSGTSEPPKKQAKLSAFFKKSKEPEDPVPAKQSAAGTASSMQRGPDHVASVINVSYDFEDSEKGKQHAGEGRTITVEFDSFYLVACYVPNAGEGLKRLDYRVNEWEPHMRAYLKSLSERKAVVYTGDLNVGHLDLDIHNPSAKHIVKQAGLTPVERAAFGQMLEESGLRDAFRHFYPDAKGQFTYWSQRLFHRPPNKGIRLDYFLCTTNMFPTTVTALESGVEGADHHTVEGVQVHDSFIVHKDTVGCSDHCPVVLVLRMP